MRNWQNKKLNKNKEGEALRILKITIKKIHSFIYTFFIQTHLLWGMDPLPNVSLLLICLIKVIFEPFSLKRSHWFSWIKDELSERDIKDFPKLLVPGSSKAKPRNTELKNFLYTNFIWKEAAIVEPVDEEVTEYQVGITREYDKKIMYCSVVLSRDMANGQVAVLQAADEVEFFGFTYPERKPIKLRLVKEGISKWELKEIPLL